MTLGEFRSKGRLGCAACYETFGRQLEPLFERVHNATRHVGRLPGTNEAHNQLRMRITDLRARLESAIREEAYEDAAQLRDELQALESQVE